MLKQFRQAIAQRFDEARNVEEFRNNPGSTVQDAQAELSLAQMFVEGLQFCDKLEAQDDEALRALRVYLRARVRVAEGEGVYAEVMELEKALPQLVSGLLDNIDIEDMEDEVLAEFSNVPGLY